jgi:hypothetical protein
MPRHPSISPAHDVAGWNDVEDKQDALLFFLAQLRPQGSDRLPDDVGGRLDPVVAAALHQGNFVSDDGLHFPIGPGRSHLNMAPQKRAPRLGQMRGATPPQESARRWELWRAGPRQSAGSSGRYQSV